MLTKTATVRASKAWSRREKFYFAQFAPRRLCSRREQPKTIQDAPRRDAFAPRTRRFPESQIPNFSLRIPTPFSLKTPLQFITYIITPNLHHLTSYNHSNNIFLITTNIHGKIPNNIQSITINEKSQNPKSYIRTIIFPFILIESLPYLIMPEEL